jgi:hypothetical protein
MGELNSHGENAYGSAARTHRLSSRRTPDYMDIRPDFLPQTSTDTVTKTIGTVAVAALAASAAEVLKPIIRGYLPAKKVRDQ